MYHAHTHTVTMQPAVSTAYIRLHTLLVGCLGPMPVHTLSGHLSQPEHVVQVQMPDGASVGSGHQFTVHAFLMCAYHAPALGFQWVCVRACVQEGGLAGGEEPSDACGPAGCCGSTGVLLCAMS